VDVELAFDGDLAFVQIPIALEQMRLDTDRHLSPLRFRRTVKPTASR
jgi:hypothetical protein